ncbi:MAG TPA: sodium-dependent transporter [Bacteroidales bacterium]|jgi:SNF family Na+-dependent transporter|nr:sodium-dependent transporter [Bacteroidales bacterium]OQC02354.1 MAG: Sodium:neurotransmitter symporter family protein [Bacteroidetes bacterium ADurb.Bin090]HNZ80456.1 sodium-dependent transporter [Bacteroidales bacterium]HOD26896.1 sodium-dependent transporter [Bacteroidales bacterium]HOH23542.1 sodium-dependent transporter [Bacteroidales bacterium]
MSKIQAKEAWGTRLGLILAMAGNAVGLGNFLRFPIQAIQNGGGAFIIPYLVSFVLLGIPLMLVEWSTGRYAGLRGHHSSPFVLQSLDKRPYWKYIGVIGLFSNIVIASYYCYIESWTLSYVYHSIIRTFDGMTEIQVSDFFDDYLRISTSTTGIPYESILFYILCLSINVWILSQTLRKGIERAAKFFMPLLIIFGLFLVVKIVTIKAGEQGAIYDGWVGLEFLWTPDLNSLSDPKVWLSAAGQIFFTLSLGMGCIQCYASYLKENDDVVLNSMTAGFMNEFVEIVIGGSIIIPISIGYFGIDKVMDLCQIGGFGLGFRTMPYLFEQWGDVLASLAGIAFFGLLFGAGITSSLAMGAPIVGFLKDNFGWSRKKGALAFGSIILAFGIPTVLFFSKGVFDEYDYWGGTVALVLYATAEIILFSWIFGVNRGWELIHQGADMRMPGIFKFILRYITPTMLILILLASAVKPKNDDWSLLSLQGWELDKNSIIGELSHKDIGPNNTWFAKEYFAERDGLVHKITATEKGNMLEILSANTIKSYHLPSRHTLMVSEGDRIKAGDVLYKGKIVNTVFYIDSARIGLLILFLMLCFFVWKAANKKSHNYFDIEQLNQ